MKRNKLIFLAMFSFLSLWVVSQRSVEDDVLKGRKLFEGSERFIKGGPSCITCHSVNNDAVIPGGLYGVNLTEAYSKYTVGLPAWLGSPGIPAMESSYQNNPLSEEERNALTAFLQHVYEEKDNQKANNGYGMMLIGGGGGLGVILILISLLWMKRKKKMVKEDIFLRQSKAHDAKF